MVQKKVGNMKVNNYINYILDIFINYDSYNPKLKIKIMRSALMVLKKIEEDVKLREKCWLVIEKTLENLEEVMFKETMDEFTMLSLLECLTLIMDAQDLKTEGVKKVEIEPDLLDLILNTSQ